MLCRETVDGNAEITVTNRDVFFKQSAGKADKGHDRLKGKKTLEPISKIRLGFKVRRETVKKRNPAESGMSNTF